MRQGGAGYGARWSWDGDGAFPRSGFGPRGHGPRDERVDVWVEDVGEGV